MTQDDTLIEQLTGESSRRTFMKASALASGGLALGASGAGTVAAQDGNGGENAKPALMFQTNYFPQAKFKVVSKPLPWAPVHSQQEDFLNEENQDLLFGNPTIFRNMNARTIEWQLPGQEWGFLFVPNKINVQQGQVYETEPGFGVFGPEDFQDFGIPEAAADDPLFTAAEEGTGLDQGFNELGLITIHFSKPSGSGQGTTTEGGGNQTG